MAMTTMGLEASVERASNSLISHFSAKCVEILAWVLWNGHALTLNDDIYDKVVDLFVRGFT